MLKTTELATQMASLASDFNDVMKVNLSLTIFINYHFLFKANITI